jgi:hypothetical protein
MCVKVKGQIQWFVGESEVMFAGSVTARLHILDLLLYKIL